ncbi:MAG TPA: glutamate racemase [Actinomycetota bacterium]|nr:glutamate racemase [Actinomycetota bacterium]
MGDSRPIGVFDSGVGGLTVVRAILDLLPHERILYVGDNARFPYGPRSNEEIRAFALEIAGYLVSRDVKMLVVACNSVEVAAIRDVADAARVPIVGVVEPGTRAGVRATRNGRVGVIATEATVRSGAYEAAVAETHASAHVVSRACPAFVDFVERGDTSSDELLSVAREYLVPLREEGVDTLILGCTHYPMLSGLIQYVIGDDVVLVSSAEETAKDVYAALVENDLLRPEGDEPEHEFVTTGDPAAFRAVAHHFLGPDVGSVGTAEIRSAAQAASANARAVAANEREASWS